MSKIKKAPVWFVQMKSETHDLLAEVARFVGVDVDWIMKANDSEKIFKLCKIKNLPTESVEKIGLILNYYKEYLGYGWARFRYENKDNDFGTASRLVYDEKKKSISIRVHLLESIRKFIKKIPGALLSE